METVHGNEIKEPLKVAELFSGLGSQARAFRNIGANFETIATCEWDIKAMTAYDLIHNGNKIHPTAKAMNKQQLLDILRNYKLSGDCKNQLTYQTLKSYKEEALRLIYSAILKTNNLVNITETKGKQLPSGIDVFTYSFPCQDLSNVGHFHGYCKGIARDANTRSGLLWQVERILLEMSQERKKLPRVLVLENVASLLSARHNKDFLEWQEQLSRLGYYNQVYALSSTDFGSAQKRRRLIMVSIFVENNNHLRARVKQYFKEHNLESEEYRKTLKPRKQSVLDCLRLDYSNEQYWKEALAAQPKDTPSRQKIWESNKHLVNSNQDISVDYVATLTTKQDRHPNPGNIYFDYEGNTKSKFRYLTPRECFMLMGFTEKDYNKVVSNNMIGRGKTSFFTQENLLHLAGNSIVVKILEQVFTQILDVLDLIDCEQKLVVDSLLLEKRIRIVRK